MSEALLVSTKLPVKWSSDDKRLIDRATKLLREKGLRLLMVCSSEVCPQNAPVLERDHTSPSGRSLVCGCRRHQFTAPPAPLSKGAARKLLRSI